MITIIQKRSFDTYLINLALIILIAFWITYQDAMAQTTEFVPKNVSLLTVDSNIANYNGFYTAGGQPSAVLEVLRERNNIDDTAVTGSIRYERTTLHLHFQYGLLETLNLGITLPHLNSKRKSDLILNDSQHSAFAESLGDAESSGMGDIEIWGLWRVFYSDETDFQLGLVLTNDNAPDNIEKTGEMPLGSGAREMALLLHWFVYSIRSPLTMFMELKQVFTEDAKIKLPSGQEISKTQSNNFAAKLDVSSHADQLGYGGGVRMKSVGNQALDGISQKDGNLSYALRGFFSYGNRYLLEKKAINHPWEVRLEMEKVVAGSNTPETQIISIQFLTYF